jgi:hypothetical protein
VKPFRTRDSSLQGENDQPTFFLYESETQEEKRQLNFELLEVHLTTIQTSHLQDVSAGLNGIQSWGMRTFNCHRHKNNLSVNTKIFELT